VDPSLLRFSHSRSSGVRWPPHPGAL